MADKNISALTNASTPLDGTEKIHVVQGANSRKLTTQDINVMGAPVKTETSTTYTLVETDRGKWIRFTNASPITLTVDDDVFSGGDEVTIEQSGAGAITITAGAGVTLNSRGALLETAGQFAVASIKCTLDAGTFTVVGDLA